MTDLQLWLQAIQCIAEEFNSITPDLKVLVEAEVGKLLSVKAALHALVERVDGAAKCESCGGQCCVCGKYHFSAVDCLAYFATGKELFQPHFAGKGCLFLNADHCVMPPEYRPFNCITFACEEIEKELSLADREAFYALEAELRQVYAGLYRLFPNSRMRRSVLTFLPDH